MTLEAVSLENRADIFLVIQIWLSTIQGGKALQEIYEESKRNDKSRQADHRERDQGCREGADENHKVVYRRRSLLLQQKPPLLLKTPPQERAAYAQQSGRDSGQTSATGCDDDAFKPPAKKAPKPLCIADLGYPRA